MHIVQKNLTMQVRNGVVLVDKTLVDPNLEVARAPV